MNSAKIGVGIIGLSATGGWAATAHVPALRALPDYFSINGLSASTSASAQAAAQKYAVSFYTDNPAELASRPDVDLVVVTVKVPFHRQLVEAALAAGKMVYCEWPLANGLAEAEELAALARTSGVRNFVGLQARAVPAVRYLRDLIAQGYIGDLLSTTLVGSGGMPWGGVATPSSVYAADRTNGATMLAIPFGHTIDAMSWILGDVGRLTATLAIRRPRGRMLDSDATFSATAADQVAVTGTLRSGAVMSAHFRGGQSRGTNFLWELNGTDGDLVVCGESGHLQFGLVSIKGAKGEAKALSDLPVPTQYLRVPAPPESYHLSLAHAYRNVIDDLRLGTWQVPTFDEALVLHRLLDRIENLSSTST